MHGKAFNDLAKLAIPERVEGFLALDPIVRTYKHRIPSTDSGEMSTKSSSRVPTKSLLEDVDCVISEIKKDVTHAAPPPRPVVTRSKSVVKRKKPSGPAADEFALAEQVFREQVEILRNSQAEKLKMNAEEVKAAQEKLNSKKIKELESEISKLRKNMATAQEELAAAQEELAASQAEVRTVKAKAENDVEAAMREGKLLAARVVMEARLKMAKEANDSSFDKSTWEVAKWQERLSILNEEAGVGQGSATHEAAGDGEGGDEDGNKGIDASPSPLK